LILLEDGQAFATTILHITMAIEVVRVLVVIVLEGKDSNHISLSAVPKDRDWLLVGHAYHALQ
jgi:hypothetical protein